MRKPFNINRFCIKLVVLILLFPVSPLFGQDIQSRDTGVLTASAQIRTEQMSISYFGHDSQSNSQLIDETKDKGLNFDIQTNALSDSGIEPINELVWAGEKIKNLTEHFLRYVFFEDKEDSFRTSDFQVKSSILQRKYQPDDLDINFALNIGVNEESKKIGFNAVKVSSYGFATYIDAIYEYKTDNLDFIFSNAHLNDFLLEGMKLKFQVTPKKAGGAFLFTMDF